MTRSDYIARKAELSGHLAAAQDAYRHAAAKLEAGEIKEPEFEAAKQTVSTIEGRLDGLETAWSVAQEKARADAKAASRDARRAAFADVENALAERLAAAEKLNELRAEVEVQGKRYGDATRRMVAAAWPHYSTDRHGRADVDSIVQFEGAHLSIERATTNIGELPGAGKDVAEFVRRQNGRIESELATILPDADATHDEGDDAANSNAPKARRASGP